MTKAEMMIKLFDYWAMRLMKRTYPMVKDTRYTGHLILVEDCKNSPIIKYNPNYLKHWNEAMLLSGIFHEIGHLKNNLPYDTKEEMVHSEYMAEKYSIVKIRKYYPQHLDEIIAWTKKVMARPKWRKMFPIHYMAFSKIKLFK